ncbi:MAG TPA: PQQ-binding-like beta-propeller repeat protein [Pirellulales bacterium]|jgi:outer membrane protein assembly factor BamB|nr:PQQ-binding-like beta-propeller repeat protein [Pirellulales bacterium]
MQNKALSVCRSPARIARGKSPRAVRTWLGLAGWLTSWLLLASLSPPVRAADVPTAAKDSWPVFRGCATATGMAGCTLPADPDLLWKFTVPKGGFEATPIIGQNLVFVGDLDGTFYALQFATGQKAWTFKMAEGTSAAAAYQPVAEQSPARLEGREAPESKARPETKSKPNRSLTGRVFVGDMDGGFYCLNATTGEKLWTFKSDGEIDSAPNFYKNLVLFGSQDATLYALNVADGKEVWRHTIDDQIRCSPTVVQDRCFLAGCDGKLHVIELEKGEEVGSVPIEAPTGSTPAALANEVFFGTEGAQFFAVDWKVPKVLWTFKDLTHSLPFRSSAAVASDMVIFGGRDKMVHAFPLHSDQELWSFTAKNRVDSSPVIVGDRVFFGSADGRIYGLDRHTGKEVWKYEAGGRFTSSPAVASERLVIASEDGFVYCFGAKK